MGKIRILIADDHAVVRDGTRQILEQEQDLEVVGEAGDGEEAIKQVTILKPDIVLMDISMPKLDGIEATKQIKAIYPATAVLILTAYDDDQFIFSLLEAGAAGYLLKSVRGQELVDAIRAVYSGESVLHPSIARKVINRYAHADGKPIEKGPLDLLSQREFEVLKLLAKSLSNKEIAEELYLSIRTVQGHLRNIFNKLMVGSRIEVVMHALKKGWITIDDIS